MSKSVEEATAAVKNYLKTTNRPYSLNDIFNNLQNKFNKSAVTKALDALVESNDVCERLNGKQKIYFYSQDGIEIDNNKLKEMDLNIEKGNATISKLKESIAMKEQQIRTFKEHVPLEQLEKQLKSKRNQLAKMKEKLNEFNAKSKNVDPEKQQKVQLQHKLLIGEWKKRKRLASEAIDMILENCSKTKRAFLEEIGVETDEDLNVVMPN